MMESGEGFDSRDREACPQLGRHRWEEWDVGLRGGAKLWKCGGCGETRVEYRRWNPVREPGEDF